MGDRSFLGELEHLVLAAALRLSGEAYGAALIREIEERTGRSVQAGSVYITVQRLEEKGFLTSATGEAEEGRGGRPKRFVTPTPAGMQALAQHREALLSIWEGLEESLEEAT